MARRAPLWTAIPLVGLIASAALAAPTPSATPQAIPAPATPSAATPIDPAQTSATTPSARSATAPGALGTKGGLERRRSLSYARCNRAAHRRTLVGGERRRFVRRCQLGYAFEPLPPQSSQFKP